MLTPVGTLLNNEAVCEVMQSCFRICFEMRLSGFRQYCTRVIILRDIRPVTVVNIGLRSARRHYHVTNVLFS